MFNALATASIVTSLAAAASTSAGCGGVQGGTAATGYDALPPGGLREPQQLRTAQRRRCNARPRVARLAIDFERLA